MERKRWREKLKIHGRKGKKALNGQERTCSRAQRAVSPVIRGTSSTLRIPKKKEMNHTNLGTWLQCVQIAIPNSFIFFVKEKARSSTKTERVDELFFGLTFIITI